MVTPQRMLQRICFLFFSLLLLGHTTWATIVEIDPYDSNDFFQFRVTNTSVSLSITAIDFTIIGGGQFDIFEETSAFTVSMFNEGGQSTMTNS